MGILRSGKIICGFRIAISGLKVPTHTSCFSCLEKPWILRMGILRNGKIICGFRIAISGLKVPTHTSRFSCISGKDLGF